jgi:hypothetical protein
MIQLVSAPILLFWIVLFTFSAVSPTTTNQTICTHNQHVIGEWKFLGESMQNKSFHCCGHNEDDFKHCPEQCGIIKLDWFGLYYGSNTTSTMAGGHPCACDALPPGRNAVHKREQYEWIPTYCHILTWNATQFCELLGPQRILFVGDSTLGQTMSTLASMITASGGHCAHQIAHARCDLLYFQKGGGLNLFQHTIKFKPDILIMTVGAHLNDIGDMWSVFGNLKYTWKKLRTELPNMRVIYKTQNPAHFHANISTQPDKIYIPTPKGLDRYNHNNFPIFDEIAHNHSIDMNFTVLDMSMLYLRSDAHPHMALDNLHYCLPGPLNVFSNILLTMLYTGEV